MKKISILFTAFILAIGIISGAIISCSPKSASTSSPTPIPQTTQTALPSHTNALTITPVLTATRPIPTPTITPTQPPSQTRFKFQSDQGYLLVEFLDDDLLHFEVSADAPGPSVDQPIFTSLMVSKTGYPGPRSLENDGNGTLETPDLIVQVDVQELCVTVIDKTRDPILKLSTFCPYNLKAEFKSLIFTRETFRQAYGLGEKFLTPDESGGNWVGQERVPGDKGNQLEAWNGGNVGNAQFPVLYLLGEGKDNYALFVDNTYKQTWDFSGTPWRASMYGDAIRFYVLSGPDLPDLRQDFMELVGHAPVPPKKAFGLWISEYGFDNWAEVESKLRTLRENHFPVDGFVLDLQWYGGIRENSDNTREGSLTWDLRNFPDPVNKIARLRDEQGVGIILIEQPYIGKNLPEHKQLDDLGYLVRQCEDCDPVYLVSNPWWGKGGMFDFTNTEASAYWHDTKREALIDAGIVGHWTDLGEPELYEPDGWYTGVMDGKESLHGELDVHNLYNLLWSQSIYEGYQRNDDTQRPFILSRSGTVGSQRYGVAMWSGDISSLLSSLATHLHVQVDMSLSGIDYFGSDIGGFLRQGINIDRTYTIWFANGMAFDVPGRVHTLNLCNCNETAPDRIGDMTSNLQNVRLRYELSPYMYSQAHRAYLYAEPVVPPAFYYYQDDPYLRDMGEEKMLGTQLLVAAETGAGKFATMVYLPSGTWVNYHTGEWIESSGELTGPFYLYPNDVFTLPVFAKAGAIIPQMFVDDQTMNIFGKRLDDSRHDELILRVYADQTPSEFILYEDDGTTIAYQDGAVRTTLISQVQDEDSISLSINPAQGSFIGEIEERDNFIHLYTNGLQVVGVMLNGEMLPQVDGKAALDGAEIGWYDAGNGLVVARSGVMSVDLAKNFIFEVTSISEQ